jgi:hypothetical protein
MIGIVKKTLAESQEIPPTCLSWLRDLNTLSKLWDHCVAYGLTVAFSCNLEKTVYSEIGL